MITAKVIGDKAVIERLKGISGRLRQELAVTVRNFGIYMKHYIGSTKLEGNPLKSHTHVLRRSLYERFTDNGGSLVTAIGNSAEYAAIHEFGGVILPKKSAFLRFQVDGQWVTSKKVTMPQRSFMRSSLAEQREEFRQRLAATTSKALKGDRA